MVRTAARSAPRRPAGRVPQPGSPGGAVAPFDYAAVFELTGRPGNVVQSVINIAPDGIFVATAIGYALEPRRERPLAIFPPPAAGAPPPAPIAPGNLTLSQIPVRALIDGFRIAPRFEQLALTPEDPRRGQTFSTQPLAADLVNRAFERIEPAGDVSFLLSLVDTATGRELQDEPVHNLASLGSADGSRPFRLLATPITFAPRSTIRLQVVEQAPVTAPDEGPPGSLFVVLYGYKIDTGCQPPPVVGSGGRNIPFDYVTRFRLTGQPGNVVTDEIPIEAGGYLATSIGYGLQIEETGTPLIPNDGAVIGNTINLQALALSAFPLSALKDGIRVRPSLVRFAFADNGQLSTALPDVLAPRLFERLNQAAHVSFRYNFFDSGSGRELQNQPIFNLAGLGAADGDRPFKRLARPLRFEPGSTLRVTVTERFGRGTLFIVFQGYRAYGGVR